MSSNSPYDEPFTVTAATRLIALLGDPVAHSLSPVFQNAAIRAAGLNGVYVALRCATEDVPGLVKGIAGAGGAGNVTVPHKQLVAGLLDSATEAVRRTGACNAFWMENGAICGDNTDVAGFEAATRSLIDSVAGARVLLLGAGGAARAVLYSLLRTGVDSVTLLNRTVERAARMKAEFDADGGRVRVADDPARVEGEAFDLVVNATSAGLHAGDPLPFRLETLRSVGGALDLVYHPDETEWVRHARELGIPAADGLEMLIQQGAAAFERWWGQPAPVEAMRAAVRNLRRSMAS